MEFLQLVVSWVTVSIVLMPKIVFRHSKTTNKPNFSQIFVPYYPKMFLFDHFYLLKDNRSINLILKHRIPLIK